MIEFTISLIDETLADPDALKLLEKVLYNEMFERKFLKPYCNRVRVRQYITEIKIGFEGITADLNDTSRICNLLIRTLAEFIIEMGLADIYSVTLAENQPKLGDLILTANDFKPKETRNSILLKDFLPADKIPEEYQCALSNEIMDEPVFTKQKPDVRYNAAHLKFWIHSQDAPKDIYTTEAIRLTDIKKDSELKKEITKFVGKTMQNGLNERKQLKPIMQRYNLSFSDSNFDKAFRRASAENNVEDMRILLQKVSNIDAKDDNPINGSTALHWAVKKGNVEATQYLIDSGARTDLLDAKGKAPIAYCNNEQILSILIPQTISSTPQLRTAMSNLSIN